MNQLKKSLKETLEFVDTVFVTRIQRRSMHGLVGVPWKEDPFLKAIMTDLKSQAQVISHSAVKLALLVNTAAANDSSLQRNIDSICEEVRPQIGTFYNIFLRLTDCAIAECLFDEAAQCVRNMMGIFDDLLTHVQDRNREVINYTAGEMTKVLSDVAETLPLANKAAYRRYLSKKCKGMKEIVDEFSEYVKEAKETITQLGDLATSGTDAHDDAAHVFQKLSLEDQNNAAVSVEDEENDDDEAGADEDDMEERDYYPSELPLVEGAVKAIQHTLDTVKICTVAATNISDTLLVVSSSSSSESGSSATPISSENRIEHLIPQCNAWVVSIVASVDRLESSCIDLGAALYPPVLSTNADLVASYSETITLLTELAQNIHDSVVPVEAKYHAFCDGKIQSEILKIRDLVVSLPKALN